MLKPFARWSNPAAPFVAILSALLAVVDVSSKALFPWLSRCRETRLWGDLAWAFGGQVGAVNTKSLRETRFKLSEDARAILAKAAEDGREGLRSDEEETYQKTHAEIDKLSTHIDFLERQEALEERLAKPSGRKTEPNAPESEVRAGSDAESAVGLSRLRRGQQESLEALRTWAVAASNPPQEAVDRARRIGVDVSRPQLTIRLSDKPMRNLHDPWEYRTAQGVGSGGIGGFVVPDELMRSLETAMLAFGGMRQVATIIRTGGGGDLPFPMVNDTATKGRIVGENATRTETGVTFTQLVLQAYMYSSDYVLVSIELMQDSAVNMAEFLGRALGERIGRITNDHFTTGTGSGEPKGITVAATLGKTALAGQTTTLIYDDLVDLQHSVDPAYRTNGRWMFADSTLKAIKKLVDDQKRPLWSAGLAVREPDTILGYPYTINQSMPAMADGANAVLFGDLSKYLIRDVRDITLVRLDERFAEYGQVAFLAFSRHDGDLLDAGGNPVKYFENTA